MQNRTPRIGSILEGTGVAEVIGVVFQKGGTGKTTTAVNLSAAFAFRGLRTLLVDFDPQASATAGLGGRGMRFEKTVIHLLEAVDRGEDPPEDTVLPTRDPNLYLVPADIGLARIEVLFEEGAEHLLRQALDRLRPKFDRIVVDGPPNLGVCTVSIVLAADTLVVPVQTHYYSEIQLQGLMALLRRISGRYGKSWARTVIVPTIAELGTVEAAQVLRNLRSAYPDLLSRTVIRKNVAIARAQREGQPIQWYDPRSPGARDYEALATELLMEEVRA